MSTLREARKDRIVQEYEHDAYKSRGKPVEPTVCTGCGAVFQEGRWTWASRPSGAHEETCPACHRINDRYPAGVLTLTGRFLDAHGEEAQNLARNEEAREKAEHALHRIMGIDVAKGRIVISTTDQHLARRIGEALHHAYGGDLDFHYVEGEKFLRVNWNREE